MALLGGPFVAVGGHILECINVDVGQPQSLLHPPLSPHLASMMPLTHQPLWCTPKLLGLLVCLGTSGVLCRTPVCGDCAYLLPDPCGLHVVCVTGMSCCTWLVGICQWWQGCGTLSTSPWHSLPTLAALCVLLCWLAGTHGYISPHRRRSKEKNVPTPNSDIYTEVGSGCSLVAFSPCPQI